MTRLQRLLSVLWLALALVAGQQAAALHALAHAGEQISQKQDSKPPSTDCDQCSAFASLSGAVTASIPAVPLLAGAIAALFIDRGHAPTASWLAFHRRSPP